MAENHFHAAADGARKKAPDAEEGGLIFRPPLYIQRAQLVQRTLHRFHCRRLVDAGCSYGDLLGYLMNGASLHHAQLVEATAIDLDPAAVEETWRVLPFSGFSTVTYTQDCSVQCLCGDLTSPSTIPPKWLPYTHDTAEKENVAALFSGATHAVVRAREEALRRATVDAVISIEVIEHIPPHLVAAYTHTIFAELGAARGARLVVLTTPNRDANVRLPREQKKTNLPCSDTCDTTPTGHDARCCSDAADAMNSVYCPWAGAPRRRHDEHFFELTRAQWRRYVAYVEACYGGYWKAHEDVLLGDGFTQGTIFVARSTAATTPRCDEVLVLQRQRATATKKKGFTSTVSSRLTSDLRSDYRSLRAEVAPPISRRTKSDCTSNTEGATPLPSSEKKSDSCVFLSRDAAIAAFPFEEVFGMSAATYATHFLTPPAAENPQPDAVDEEKAEREVFTTDDLAPSDRAFSATPPPPPARKDIVDDVTLNTSSLSRGVELLYTCAGYRVVDGIPLWVRFKEVVRRCCLHADTPSPSSIDDATTQRALPTTTMVDFYTSALGPALHVFLEDCTLPLLLRSVAEQRQSWARALRRDAADWHSFLRRGRQRDAVVRTRPLRVKDAHVAAGVRRGAMSAAMTAPDIPDLSAGHESSASMKKRSPPCSQQLLLFPEPSVAWETLTSLANEVPATEKWCREGVRLLEDGVMDSIGLLLVEWLHLHISAFIATWDRDEKAKSSGAVEAGSSSETVTLKCLPAHLLHVLFFMVSVDASATVYDVLRGGWGSRGRHLAALHHDVTAALSSTTATAAKVQGARRCTNTTKRRRVESEKKTTQLPWWLQALLSYPMAVP